MDDPNTQLPLDYKMTVAEDFYVDDIVETLYLTDVFSVGPYQITLYNGILFDSHSALQIFLHTV